MHKEIIFSAIHAPLGFENERMTTFREEAQRTIGINHHEEEVLFGVQIQGDARNRKLEMPIFSGSNVNQWIYKV